MKKKCRSLKFMVSDLFDIDYHLPMYVNSNAVKSIYYFYQSRSKTYIVCVYLKYPYPVDERLIGFVPGEKSLINLGGKKYYG